MDGVYHNSAGNRCRTAFLRSLAQGSARGVVATSFFSHCLDLARLVALVLVVTLPGRGIAQPVLELGREASREVIIDVRAVEAQNVPTSEPLDARLGDIQAKLAKLEFNRFTLLGSETRTVSLMSKETLSVNGQSLTVRPLYIKDDRVGMWLKWRDPEGMDVLDTRMHFDCGESVITGTESKGDRGIVLAIRVSQKRP